MTSIRDGKGEVGLCSHALHNLTAVLLINSTNNNHKNVFSLKGYELKDSRTAEKDQQTPAPTGKAETFAFRPNVLAAPPQAPSCKGFGAVVRASSRADKPSHPDIPEAKAQRNKDTLDWQTLEYQRKLAPRRPERRLLFLLKGVSSAMPHGERSRQNEKDIKSVHRGRQHLDGQEEAEHPLRGAGGVKGSSASSLPQGGFQCSNEFIFFTGTAL